MRISFGLDAVAERSMIQGIESFAGTGFKVSETQVSKFQGFKVAKTFSALFVPLWLTTSESSYREVR
jgi:hypothetical protein